jgi:hypothetical protein
VGLILYPLFVALGIGLWLCMWAAILLLYFFAYAAVLVLYFFAYACIFVLTVAAVVIRSSWRPKHPPRPKAPGRSHRRVLPGKTSSEEWASSGAVPQARYSTRR